MSATLTWFHAGPQAKTGTAINNFIDDLVSLVNSKSGDANYSWQVASSNNAATPYYVVLKPKSGAAGRILFVAWTSNPAGNNAAILNATPATGNVHAAWFPNGNVNTPSNLTASSGTILGDDTNCTLVTGMTLSSIYTTSMQLSMFDSAEAFLLIGQTPASPTVNKLFGVGQILVDDADNAYGAAFNTIMHTFGSSSGPIPYAATALTTASGNASIRSNVYTSKGSLYHAFEPSGTWADSAINSTDVLSDAGAAKYYFVPVKLIGNTKGGGFTYKYRQFAWGPAATSAFEVYNITGPVVAARQVNSGTTGGSAYPWATNFKL